MFDAGSITAKMVLDKTDWDRSVAGVQVNLKSMTERTQALGLEMLHTGRQISMVGARMAMLGTIVLSPMVLAYMSLNKQNEVLQSKLADVTKSFQDLAAGLVVNLLPYVVKLSDFLKDLAIKFNNLPAPVRKFIVDLSVISGSLLIVTGVITKLIGMFTMLAGAITLTAVKVGSLVETLALLAMYHPVVAAITAITLALGGLVLSNEKSKASFSDMLTGVKDKLSGFMKFWTGLGVGPLTGINDLFNKGSVAIGAKMAQWTAQGKNAIEELGKQWKDSMAKVDVVAPAGASGKQGISKWAEFGAGIKEGLREQILNFSNFGEMAKEVVSRSFSEMTNTISTVFFDAITGKFDDLKQAFADFGNSVLKIFTDLVAKILIYFAVIEPLLVMFPELRPALSMGSFADGTDAVPYTGMYKIHEGEKVTPRYDSNKDGQTLTIVNQITSGFVNAAIANDPNTVVNVINENTLRNGVTRTTIKRRK